MLLASDRTSETSGRRPLTVLINIDNQAISGRSEWEGSGAWFMGPKSYLWDLWTSEGRNDKLASNQEGRCGRTHAVLIS